VGGTISGPIDVKEPPAGAGGTKSAFPHSRIKRPVRLRPRWRHVWPNWAVSGGAQAAPNVVGVCHNRIGIVPSESGSNQDVRSRRHCGTVGCGCVVLAESAGSEWRLTKRLLAIERRDDRLGAPRGRGPDRRHAQFGPKCDFENMQECASADVRHCAFGEMLTRRLRRTSRRGFRAFWLCRRGSPECRCQGRP
jgi:hypothetical protein